MNLHGIDLNLLVAFDALMAERNVTRAGARVGRTQPAMSAALSRLRHVLRDELFVRGPSGLQPTLRALELAEPISAALLELQRTLSFTQDFDPATASMTATLGLSSHAETVLMPRLVPILAQRAPGVDLRVQSNIGRDDAIRMLDQGDIDMAVGVPPSATGRISTARLFQDRFVCVLRRDHPAANALLDLETFLRFPHVIVSPDNDGLDVADAALATKGVKRRTAVTVSSTPTALRIVAETDMIATVMESEVVQSGHAGRLALQDFPLPLNPTPFVLSWHRRNDSHPAQRWLRACVLGAFPNIWQQSQQLCSGMVQDNFDA